MAIPRIYLSVPLETGIAVTLDDNASNHVVRVLRLKAGAPLTLFNGQGGEYEATLTGTRRNAVQADVGAFSNKESDSSLLISLAQCISKGERMGVTIQKAVELGVSEIIPLFSERCVVQLDEKRLQKRMQHWQSVIISACEQCGRHRLPTLVAAQGLPEWLTAARQDCTQLMLDPDSGNTLTNIKEHLDNVTLLIGPEGGLSEQERQAAIHNGFSGMSLGPRILRTETAPIAALAAIQVLWGDMG